jgi:hypothetical protein
MYKWMGLLLLVFLFACGDEKNSLSGDAPVDAEDFIAAFPDIKLPKTFYDTGLSRTGDTTTISRAVFVQFIPDSALTIIAGSNSKASIKPVGKIKSEEELYLLTKFTENKKSSLVVFVLDNDNKYLGAKGLVTNKVNDGYSHYVSINREPTFNIAREKFTKDNQMFYTRTGYAYNKDAGFMVVVNDSNEDTRKQDSIINPIDTFTRVNKYSGDYLKDKKNFISLRDGKNANTYMFFVHFEKSNGECVGELKGELVMKDETTGQYTAGGDPCVINFKFSGSQIQMKEEGTCGNYRGIKCFFEDRYSKKKEPKAKQKKK